ncbi:MAG: hypothetical protein AAFS11_05210, partial [Planctomycetota bacterium]
DATASAVLRNASALFDALYPANPALPGRGTPEQWHHLADTLRTLDDCLPAVGGTLEDELRWTSAMSRLACRIVGCRRESTDDPHLKRDLARAQREFSRLWHLRSRPGGLERTVSLLDGLGAGIDVYDR